MYKRGYVPYDYRVWSYPQLASNENIVWISEVTRFLDLKGWNWGCFEIIFFILFWDPIEDTSSIWRNILSKCLILAFLCSLSEHFFLSIYQEASTQLFKNKVISQDFFQAFRFFKTTITLINFTWNLMMFVIVDAVIFL